MSRKNTNLLKFTYFHLLMSYRNKKNPLCYLIHDGYKYYVLLMKAEYSASYKILQFQTVQLGTDCSQGRLGQD